MRSIFITLFVLCVSCKQNHVPQDPLDYFNQTFNLSPKIIKTNRTILSGGRMMLLNDHVLAINNMKENQYLTLVDVTSGEILRQMIRKGKGPGEMTMLQFCIQSRRDSLLIYDPNLKTLFGVNLKKAVSDEKYTIEPVMKMDESGILFKIDTCFVASMVYSNGHRFRIYDSHGKAIRSCLHYQKPERYKKIPDNVYATGYQGCYAVKPDNKKFVFATVSSGNIEFFDFRSDTIVMTTNLPFYDPKMTVKKGVCITDRETIKAFIDVDCTDDYVYMLYSGRPIMEFLQEQTCNHLLVFNWEGKPVKHYFLQEGVKNFKIDSSGDKLYGLAYIPELTIVQYDLK